MANAREIQARIKSIKQTQQITGAMYMISSSKLTKAKEALAASEPYFNALSGTIGNILCHAPDVESVFFRNPFADNDNRKKVGCLVITSDKGLAGAYNLNVIKKAEEVMSPNKADNYIMAVGETGRHYFALKNMKMAKNFDYTPQNVSIHAARDIMDTVVDLYQRKQLDEVYIVYTKMRNAMQCEAVAELILPLAKLKLAQMGEDIYPGEMEFHPNANAVIDSIVPNYIAGFIYGALVESFCSEQNARMTAMQSANNSANDMLHDLSAQYNRSRQAAITQEITEVIGGAKAKKK